MTNFEIKIVEENGDINIYTDARKIVVNEDTIAVDYEDTNAVHNPNDVHEIRIKPKF